MFKALQRSDYGHATTRRYRLPGTAARLLGLCAALALSACGDGPRVSPALAPIEALRGQWVIVNYWAEWCRPCIREVPELNRLDAREDMAVLGVNFDGESGAALEAQREALGIRFASLLQDPAAPLGIERPEVLPTSLIISPAGELLQVLVGVQTEQSLLAATVGATAGALGAEE